MSVMLYKHPGKHKLHGDMFDYVVVDQSQVADHLEAGWSLTTTEAKEPGGKKPGRRKKAATREDGGADKS